MSHDTSDSAQERFRLPLLSDDLPEEGVLLGIAARLWDRTIHLVEGSAPNERITAFGTAGTVWVISRATHGTYAPGFRDQKSCGGAIPEDRPAPGGRGWRESKIQSGRSWKILTMNVGGSRDAIKWAIEQDVQFVLLQEHRQRGGTLAGAQVMCRAAGWNGLWTEAQQTGPHGFSGGVAILARSPLAIYRGTGT